MKGIILYKSKYGATKKYAEWIAQETAFDIAAIGDTDIGKVRKYDAIILGGGIYASGIAGLQFLRKNMGMLTGKKIIVFCVGASPYNEETFQAVSEHNMTNELQNIPCFYCRGSWDMASMNVIDRNLCKLLRKSVAKKEAGSYEIWEKALMAAGDEKCDWTDRKYIKPILEELKQQGR